MKKEEILDCANWFEIQAHELTELDDTISGILQEIERLHEALDTHSRRFDEQENKLLEVMSRLSEQELDEIKAECEEKTVEFLEQDCYLDE